MSDLEPTFSPRDSRVEKTSLLGTFILNLEFTGGDTSLFGNSVLSLEFTGGEYKSIWNLYSQRMNLYSQLNQPLFSAWN